MKYTLFTGYGDIVAEGNNKAELIKAARRIIKPATVIDKDYYILFENKAQQVINNKRS